MRAERSKVNRVFTVNAQSGVLKQKNRREQISGLVENICGFTLISEVAHVQDGSEQLGDLPVLLVCEHQHLRNQSTGSPSKRRRSAGSR